MKPAVVLLAVLAALPAHAQQFTLFATGGKSTTNYHGQADLQSLNLEWSRPRTPLTEVGLSIGSEFLWQPVSWSGGRDHSPNESVRGLATSLMLRHSFAAHPRLFVEISTGPLWTEKQVPAATSRINFLSQGGAGVIIGSRWQTPVLMAVRVAHISNAGLAHHNPGINFTSLAMGLRFRP